MLSTIITFVIERLRRLLRRLGAVSTPAPAATGLAGDWAKLSAGLPALDSPEYAALAREMLDFTKQQYAASMLADAAAPAAVRAVA